MMLSIRFVYYALVIIGMLLVAQSLRARLIGTKTEDWRSPLAIGLGAMIVGTVSVVRPNPNAYFVAQMIGIAMMFVGGVLAIRKKQADLRA